MYDKGIQVKHIAKKFNLSKGTVYNYLIEYDFINKSIIDDEFAGIVPEDYKKLITWEPL